MAEVRVRARLANAIDEELVRRGQLSRLSIREVEVNAVISDEEVRCKLPRHVAQTLGIERGVERTGPVSVIVMNRKETETAVMGGNEVVIGRTTLAKMDLAVQGNRLVPSHQAVLNRV